MVERSDQSVNSLPSTTPQHNIPDMLAEAALGLRLDHDTAARRDRVPGLRRWYPLDAGLAATPLAVGAVLAALALIGSPECLAWRSPRRPDSQEKEHL